MKRMWVVIAMSLLVLASASVQSVWAQAKAEEGSSERINVKRLLPDSINVGVSGIAVDGNFIYAATTNYLWCSSDRGNTWVRRGKESGLDVFLGWVTSVAVIDSGFLLASSGDGIFRSTDRGVSWKYIFFAPPYGGISTFLVTKDKTIFAGDNGIFRSTDNGYSWVQVADSVVTYPYIWKMIQTDKGTVIAGIASGMPTSGRGIARSTDNGNSWTVVNNGFSTHKNIMGLTMDIGQSIVFAVTYDDGTYESRDDGKTWTKQSSVPLTFGRAAVSTPSGIFFGFADAHKENLWRKKGYDWTEVPIGASGLFIESLAQFDGSSIIVGGNYGIWMISFDIISTPVEEVLNGLPTEFALSQNYPNPFNPATTIEFSIPKRANVNLTVYNALGQRIETLVNRELVAGTHRTEWNAGKYPSGIYFYVLEAANFKASKKMLLVK